VRNRFFVLVLLITALIAISAPDASAQMSANGVYVELLGSGVVPTINYERLLKNRWYGRAGFSVVTGESDNDTDTTFVVPLTMSSVRSPESNHHLEAGGGVTVIFGDRQELFFNDDDDEKFSNVALTGLFGYRYQKPDGGFQFRALFTPALVDGDFAPWFGVSFGYAW
jgi:hypothetical protein